MTSFTRRIAVCALIFLQTGIASAQGFQTKEFLYGACVYPEIQTKDDWKRMLATFEDAHFTVVRVAESAWGLIQTEENVYDFQWLDEFLREAEKRNIKVILGTSSYVPPQWLIKKFPDLLLNDQHTGAYPMTKKSPCIDHEIYRKYVSAFVKRLAEHYKSNPTVIGWQLDNELDITINRQCTSPASEKAWQNWLTKNFASPDTVNKKFQLNMYGFQVKAFNQMPIPKASSFNTISNSIKLNYFRFEKDHVLDFLKEQADVLRRTVKNQWITTNWVTQWNAVTDDPKTRKLLDISGVDVYHSSGNNPGGWKNISMQYDINRSATPAGAFIVMETTIGPNGNTSINQFEWAGGAMVQRDRFLMTNIHPAAFGAVGLLYWSGNRIQGTHAPYYGGVVGWDNTPELEIPWVQELGAFYKTWGKTLLENPVKATVAVYTDFDQRSALQVVEQVKGSRSVLPLQFDLLHRLGYGVDAINAERMKDLKVLQNYSLLILPAATIFNDPAIIKTVEQYVTAGGKVLVTPLTDYLSSDALFNNEGLGHHLQQLTGTNIKTTRLFGGPTAVDYKNPTVVWQGFDTLKQSSVGLDGLVEFMQVNGKATTIASFDSRETILDNYPAAVINKIGKGAVLKLAFLPDENSLSCLIDSLAGVKDKPTRGLAPEGMSIIPRTDGSVFILNTTNKVLPLQISRSLKDRIANRYIPSASELQPYEVLWLE